MKKSLFIRFIIIILSVSVTLNAQISLNYNSTYRYLKGKDASLLSPGWNTAGFNDTDWASGVSPFRYGDGVSGTVLDDMMNNYSTIYLRTSFSATNAQFIKQLSLSCDFDDGFILWINGIIAQSENEL